MDPMLESFLQESRENIEAAGGCFLALEKTPGDAEIMNDLFRSIHTMKGSSGLFDVAPLTRVVHAAEDVLDVVREGGLELTPEHVDLFLDSLDQVNAWLDSLEATEALPDEAEADGQILSAQLRALLGEKEAEDYETADTEEAAIAGETVFNDVPDWFSDVPDAARLSSFANKTDENDILALVYTPDEQCFFNGDDPIHTVKSIPGLEWFKVDKCNDWGDVESLDPFHCNLKFYCLITEKESKVRDFLRYVAEQIEITQLQSTQLIFPVGDFGDGVAYEALLSDATKAIEEEDYATLKKNIRPLLEIGSLELIQTSALAWMSELLNQDEPSKPWLSSLLNVVRTGDFKAPNENELSADVVDAETEDTDASAEVTSGSTVKEIVAVENIPASNKTLFDTQLRILAMPCPEKMLEGRVASTVKLLVGIFKQLGWDNLTAQLESAGNECLEKGTCEPLADSLKDCLNGGAVATEQVPATPPKIEKPKAATSKEAVKDTPKNNAVATGEHAGKPEVDVASKPSSKTLRVDQERIDVLMDLVGELVVAKNALPFLARRAEEEFKVKELSKEIKSQYAVINRLSEELQSAMMSVRMVPVSSVFQRFPRLVRDLSRRLEKNIELVMEGEETEADKNVIENLADPLIHLVRNSLDHGIEMPADRRAAGKPEKGTLILRATPMDDQVIIEIIDDGKGIDPNVIKQKAYEKGVISEEKLDSISDQEAIELIFAAGLSSKDEASDLSGRGVGMDVVRTAVQDAGGTVSLTSELNVGSTIKLSLPLSMAVAQVMMVEVDKQVYGIPMDAIRETVRVPIESIQRVKHNEAIVLRDKLIPLRRLRKLLSLPENEQEIKEEAVLIVTRNGQEIGLIIDDFHEGIDVIQKPLEGVMGSYPTYVGATLLGDGRVLLILDLKELI